MPVRTNLAADDQTKDSLGHQVDILQNILHRISVPLFATLDQALDILSYLNPLTYIAIIFSFIYRLFVSPYTHRSILGSSILGLVLVLSLLSSIIAYAAFYRAHVPRVGFNLPVWLQYGENRVPYAILDFSNLAPEISVDQAYDVHLHLTVPTNDRNMNMGNFMVQLTLSTASPHNITLHHISRPASLVYEPTFARVLHAFKYLRKLFFLSSPFSAQHIKIPLLEQRIIYPSSLGKLKQIVYGRIEVGRQDVYNSQNSMIDRHGWGELQIYKATLVFDAHLDGLIWALYYHPYISFCFFSAIFFTSELVAVLCTWIFVLYRTSSTDPPRSGPFLKDESPGASVLDHTEVDNSSASSKDNRSLSDMVGGERDPHFENPSMEMEPMDDAVLVRSSRPTNAECSPPSATSSGLTSRRPPRISK